MKRIYLILIGLLCFSLTWGQEIKIDGNKFTLDNSEIWFNGINTPWHLFGDFGRTDFNSEWWTNEFAKYKQNNINLARVWIHMSGEFSPNIDATGHVSGTNDIFWDHMDHLMNVSEQNGVYLVPALFSFDITKNGYKTTEQWRKWIQSEENIQSYIDNVLIPMVKRYDNRKFILAWEICNEPEWMFENSEHGPQSFNDVQKMHAMLATAIHENCSKFVTTGSAAPKWNSPIYDSWGDKEGNMFSDEALSKSINNSKAFLDFYQYHWYPWQSEWMKSPFTMTTVEYGVDDRPVIVGESEGNDVCDKYVCQTVSQMYESAYVNGFDGVCAWKTPQNDGHGTFEKIAVATNEFYNNHPKLVYPDGSDPIAVTGVTLSESSITIEEGKSFVLTAEVIPANASDKRTKWSSANVEIASVVNGTVTAKKEGVTKIMVSSYDGSYVAECNVIVEKRDITSSTITLDFNYSGVGDQYWFTTDDIANINSWSLEELTVNGVDYTNKWSNSMPAKVNGGYTISFKSKNSWGTVQIKAAARAVTVSNGVLTNNTLKLFPNPSNKKVTVSGIENAELVQIIASSGQMVFERNVKNQSELTISVEELTKGIYLVKLVGVDGKSVTKKLIVQ
ncbi:hypothetical protein BZG02_14610 [Labilibaculum filiforme]|uniref:BIG2 domain-containing protein n=1 Tax=Labilibaculum filiforme TaxID=1940526 RepID=A0A2N3HUW7_9BACT|nr:Ig-like domain-containing protein [Labilibaculum filiforme]PKQ61854.1 hypothetical protein BZG02_14610 [Labilibaculum filiforme]